MKAQFKEKNDDAFGQFWGIKAGRFPQLKGGLKLDVFAHLRGIISCFLLVYFLNKGA